MQQQNEGAEAISPARSKRARKWALVGPAIIIGGLQFGPGNVVSSTTVGAQHGYSVLWLVILSGVLMFGFTDMGVRIGIANRDSTLQAIRAGLGPVATAVVAVACFIIATLFLIGSLIGGAVGLTVVFGGSIEIWSVVCGLLGLALFWSREPVKFFV